MRNDDFETANRAFDLMTLPERKRVLVKFSDLRYPLITDRFFEAVHAVIVENSANAAVLDASGRPIAPPQPALPVRPPGPHESNTDARRPLNRDGGTGE